MIKQLFSLLLCLIILASLKIEAVSEERMAVFRVLMNKEYMLTFLSHPKVIKHFLDEKRKVDDAMVKSEVELRALMKQFPNEPRIKRAFKVTYGLNKITRPIPSEEVVVPFLTCGILNTSDIQDSTLLKEVQDLQINLFKNYEIFVIL